jgi:hypothetical protein
MDAHGIWWVVLVPLAALTVWGLVDSWWIAPRRAARIHADLAHALGQPTVRESEFLSRVEWMAQDRAVTVRSEYVGSGGSVRGMRGHLLVLATPLRVPAWALHDLEVRPHGTRGDWDERFARVESGVPVRDGWLSPAVQQAIDGFFAHPLAVGRLRTDRGELQHVAPFADTGDTSDAAAVRDLLARFAGVAAALDGAATRRHPMA